MEEFAIYEKHLPKKDHFYAFRKFCLINFKLEVALFHLYRPSLQFICYAS